jgi:hypothetical protein
MLFACAVFDSFVIAIPPLHPRLRQQPKGAAECDLFEGARGRGFPSDLEGL